MSGSDRPSPPWVCSKVGPPRPELPAAAKRAIHSSLRTSRPPASTPHISSSAVTHLLTPTFLSLRRACGSISAGKSHEMRGIHSSTGMQMPCPKDMSSSQTSPLILPACAAAQVNVDFLDGEDTARSGQDRLHIQGKTSRFSTSSSAWSMWAIFWRGAPHERASPASRSPPLAAARYCHAARASASQPSTDSAWQGFSCFGVEDGCFHPVDGSGRACGSAARCCGEAAAIWRLLPPRACSWQVARVASRWAGRAALARSWRRCRREAVGGECRGALIAPGRSRVVLVRACRSRASVVHRVCMCGLYAHVTEL